MFFYWLWYIFLLKNCRLRWISYLRPDLKRGAFSQQEENSIVELHAILGNRYYYILLVNIFHRHRNSSTETQVFFWKFWVALGLSVYFLFSFSIFQDLENMYPEEITLRCHHVFTFSWFVVFSFGPIFKIFSEKMLSKF